MHVCNIADIKISGRITILAIAMTHPCLLMYTMKGACHGMSMSKILIQIAQQVTELKAANLDMQLYRVSKQKQIALTRNS